MKIPLLPLALCAALPGAASAEGFYAEAATEDFDTGHLAFGYEFASGLGVEVGYRRTNEGGTVRFDGEHRLDAVEGTEIAVRGDIHLQPRFALTGRLGLLDWSGETLSIGAQDGLYVEEKESVSPILGAGVRFDMTEHVALIGEVVYTDAHEIGNDAREVRPLLGLRGSF